ncbi:DUF3052 domain-containing protein [Bacillus sp. EB106-08-02-XG196]|jgi:hypothetical protein|uniref:DUF3052 domain-containing protein n=1 Tax=Bacillus sp. EB106-08-02-XG196 TaxID=2737049 RepID=UPI0015C48BDD|nr:DUF3052 domain-containing protein [Bacillus sp. EB106-08-02-XG196]NWQ40865.1 DUF3052 domain-containing protein [Bacillus sp. EB106-08-02-XG196]
MTEISPILKKLNFKDQGQPVLVINAPKSYDDIKAAFEGEVHQQAELEIYDFVQVFGSSNEELQSNAKKAAAYVKDDGLFWLCYPKKSSKTYKGSDCSRETVTGMLSEEGYEPVRQIAIDDDWSALRFRKPGKIKKMVRDFAVTDEGIKRTKKE